MRIEIKIRPEDTTEVLHDLIEQQSHYGARTQGEVQVLLGDRFNVYVYPVKDKRRIIEILPKDTPV
jgi:hypothetical protein